MSRKNVSKVGVSNAKEVNLMTMTKRDLNAYMRLKSLQSLSEMTEDLEKGDFVTVSQLQNKATDNFLNSRSISGYIGKNHTIRKVTDKRFVRDTRIVEKKYVNIDDDNDYFIRVSRVKGYEVI